MSSFVHGQTAQHLLPLSETPVVPDSVSSKRLSNLLRFTGAVKDITDVPAATLNCPEIRQLARPHERIEAEELLERMTLALYQSDAVTFAKASTKLWRKLAFAQLKEMPTPDNVLDEITRESAKRQGRQLMQQLEAAKAYQLEDEIAHVSRAFWRLLLDQQARHPGKPILPEVPRITLELEHHNDLSQRDLSGFILANIHFKSKDGQPVSFKKSDLSSTLIANCLLTEVSFQDTKLYSTVFCDNDLSGADFRGAQFNGTSLDPCTNKALLAKIDETTQLDKVQSKHMGMVHSSAGPVRRLLTWLNYHRIHCVFEIKPFLLPNLPTIKSKNPA